MDAGSSILRSQAGFSKFGKWQSSVVEATRSIYLRRAKSRQSAKWVFANFVAAWLFYIGLTQLLVAALLKLVHPAIIYIDLGLCLLFAWNAVVDLYVYLLPSIHKEQVVLSPQQKRLLGINDNDKSFTSIFPSSQKFVQTTPTTQSFSWPTRRTSSRTTPSGSFVQDPSPGRTTPLSTGQASQVVSSFYGGYPRTQSPTKTPDRLVDASPSSSTFRNSPSSASVWAGRDSPGRSPGKSPTKQDDQIIDPDLLEKYLKTQEEIDMRHRRAQMNSSHSPSQSFWTYGRSTFDFIPTFGVYQLATRSPQSTSSKDDDASPNPFKYDELWKKLSISKNDLDHWTENLRKWIAQTVIEKLVEEISNINNVLVQIGCSELQIGSVSINSLRNVALTKSQHVPSLNSVIPYLDVTTNQEYLINRIEELSTGGCLRLYRWDSGGMYKGKTWDQELPTDAQILLHLFCTYMDTHLPSNPRYPDGKSFTGLHFLKTPDKPSDRKSEICIHQTRNHPPHFKVLVGDEVHDIPKGRHNLFHTILVFLHLVKTKQHGMLERVNLGMSGINILWILKKK